MSTTPSVRALNRPEHGISVRACVPDPHPRSSPYPAIRIAETDGPAICSASLQDRWCRDWIPRRCACADNYYLFRKMKAGARPRMALPSLSCPLVGWRGLPFAACPLRCN